MSQPATTTEAPVVERRRPESYWANVWRQLRKNRPGMAGLGFILILAGVAAFAPLIANDRPIVAVYKGSLVFPAVTTYVRTWVPWRSLQNQIESFSFSEGSEWYPFSPNYLQLTGNGCRLKRQEGSASRAPEDWDPTRLQTVSVSGTARDVTLRQGTTTLTLPSTAVAVGSWEVWADFPGLPSEAGGDVAGSGPTRVTRVDVIDNGPFELRCEVLDHTWREAHETDDMAFAVWPAVPWSPYQVGNDEVKQRPATQTGHLMGTDDNGRDVLARLVHGTVVAFLVGVISQSIAVFIGVLLGLAAGYFGGWVDMVLSRFTEVVICFPRFFLIIAVIAFIEQSIMNIMIVLGIFGWPGIFRLIRGEVLKVRSLDYIAAAKAMGVPPGRIMLRHVLPNAVAPVFVAIAFGIAAAVLIETSLSFLGFGDISVSSWGEIVSQGRKYVAQGLWHLTIFPGLAIFITLTAFNLFGQGLRDAMDPKLRR